MPKLKLDFKLMERVDSDSNYRVKEKIKIYVTFDELKEADLLKFSSAVEENKEKSSDDRSEIFKPIPLLLANFGGGFEKKEVELILNNNDIISMWCYILWQNHEKWEKLSYDQHQTVFFLARATAKYFFDNFTSSEGNNKMLEDRDVWKNFCELLGSLDRARQENLLKEKNLLKQFQFFGKEKITVEDLSRFCCFLDVFHARLCSDVIRFYHDQLHNLFSNFNFDEVFKKMEDDVWKNFCNLFGRFSEEMQLELLNKWADDDNSKFDKIFEGVVKKDLWKFLFFFAKLSEEGKILVVKKYNAEIGSFFDDFKFSDDDKKILKDHNVWASFCNLLKYSAEEGKLTLFKKWQTQKVKFFGKDGVANRTQRFLNFLAAFPDNLKPEIIKNCAAEDNFFGPGDFFYDSIIFRIAKDTGNKIDPSHSDYMRYDLAEDTGAAVCTGWCLSELLKICAKTESERLKLLNEWQKSAKLKLFGKSGLIKRGCVNSLIALLSAVAPAKERLTLLLGWMLETKPEKRLVLFDNAEGVIYNLLELSQLLGILDGKSAKLFALQLFTSNGGFKYLFKWLDWNDWSISLALLLKMHFDDPESRQQCVQYFLRCMPKKFEQYCEILSNPEKALMEVCDNLLQLEKDNPSSLSLDSAQEMKAKMALMFLPSDRRIDLTGLPRKGKLTSKEKLLWEMLIRWNDCMLINFICLPEKEKALFTKIILEKKKNTTQKDFDYEMTMLYSQRGSQRGEHFYNLFPLFIEKLAKCKIDTVYFERKLDLLECMARYFSTDKFKEGAGLTLTEEQCNPLRRLCQQQRSELLRVGDLCDGISKSSDAFFGTLQQGLSSTKEDTKEEVDCKDSSGCYPKDCCL